MAYGKFKAIAKDVGDLFLRLLMLIRMLLKQSLVWRLWLLIRKPGAISVTACHSPIFRCARPPHLENM